ncbi:MAG TPA: hypothetical protein VFX59_02935 [Polyangiales bacterium]|nr:hypothetical protein [Polyangiales bacterium]
MASFTWRIAGLLLIGALAHCADDSDPEEPETDDSESPDGARLDASSPARDAGLDATRVQPALDAAPADASRGDASRVDASGVDAQTVDASLRHTFAVDSKVEWTASGFQAQAGRCYDVAAKIDDKWLDLDVPADLSGWIDKQDPRLVLFTPFRRVVQDDIAFYQFAACVNKELDQCFPIGAASTVCPKTTGELFFFLNDAPGFESNNVGTATVTITPR